MAGRGAGVLGVGFWVLGVTFSLDSGFRRNDGKQGLQAEVLVLRGTTLDPSTGSG